jgi:hypothetical protein
LYNNELSHSPKMKTKTITSAFAIVFATVSSALGGSTTYNLTSQFSTTSNPNGVWSYDENNVVLTQTQQNSAFSGWGNISDFDSSIDVVTSPIGGFDSQVGDIVMHAPSTPYGGPSAYMDINWTSPANGVISITGSAWDDQFDVGRDANWWLSVGGTTIASRGSVYGLQRSDPGAQFSNNVLPTDSLTDIDVTAGEVVEIAVAADTYYGHFVGVQEDITLTTPDAGSSSSLVMIALGGLAFLRRSFKTDAK